MPDAIADLAMLGDCQGAAMADRDGAIVWWCAPFDSDASDSSPFTAVAMRVLAAGDVATGALPSLAGVLGR